MKRAEKWLIAAVLLALGLWWGVTAWGGTPAMQACVYVDGELIAELPLDVDATYHHQVGGDDNLLVVQDGRVYMDSANCPDGYCVRQGMKRKAGESIVCLPHRLLVELTGGTGEVDAYVR